MLLLLNQGQNSLPVVSSLKGVEERGAISVLRNKVDIAIEFLNDHLAHDKTKTNTCSVDLSCVFKQAKKPEKLVLVFGLDTLTIVDH